MHTGILSEPFLLFYVFKGKAGADIEVNTH